MGSYEAVESAIIRLSDGGNLPGQAFDGRALIIRACFFLFQLFTTSLIMPIY
jgi:hypothetical protein